MSRVQLSRDRYSKTTVGLSLAQDKVMNEDEYHENH